MHDSRGDDDGGDDDDDACNAKIFSAPAGYSNIASQSKNIRITTLPGWDRIGVGDNDGGGEKRENEKERKKRRGRGGELFSEAVIANEAGPSKRHGKRFY